MAAVATTGVTGVVSTRTYTSAVPLTRGIVVTQGASDGLVAICGANGIAVGVVPETQPTIGAPIGIITDGEAVVQIGAAVAANQYVISNAAGQVIPSAAAADNVVGKAVSSGVNAGDEIVIRVQPSIR
jgi:hypothetical protein